MYQDKYHENLLKYGDDRKALMSEKEKKSLHTIAKDIRALGQAATEMMSEIELNTVLLTKLHEDFTEKLKQKIADSNAALTITHEGISITRQQLRHSNFVASAGYNEKAEMMDIEFNTGKVYRYKNVPSEFFASVETRSSLKGLRADLNAFEYEQIK
ncbi:MAG: KTSC domain-containing protein [Bacteroidales bacterium]|nr:KTSC domain-containing protein [Bacteroidales bacterium]